MPKATTQTRPKYDQMTPVELAQAINEKLDRIVEKLDRIDEKAARIEALLREMLAEQAAEVSA